MYLFSSTQNTEYVIHFNIKFQLFKYIKNNYVFYLNRDSQFRMVNLNFKKLINILLKKFYTLFFLLGQLQKAFSDLSNPSSFPFFTVIFSFFCVSYAQRLQNFLHSRHLYLGLCSLDLFVFGFHLRYLFNSCFFRSSCIRRHARLILKFKQC